jgi:hypothetical protein
VALERAPFQPAPEPVGPVLDGQAAPVRLGGAGAPLDDDAILSLQRTAGNRAVGRAIERGLIHRDDVASPQDTSDCRPS